MSNSFLSSVTENSHIIQVYTASRTIWRGHDWSSLTIDVKVDKSIREKQEPHMLCSVLEECSSKTLHLPWISNQIKVEFEKNPLRDHPYQTNVLQNEAKYTLKVQIHKDLFQHGVIFRVIVAAKMQNDRSKFIVFGASEQITVTNFSLSIEQRFDMHDAFVKVDDSTYVYYNKLPSKFHGLEVSIHLLNENGEICTCPMPKMELKTQLIYEDGIPVPIMPMKPLKIAKRKRNNTTLCRSENPILTCLDSKAPVVGGSRNSTVFRFSLEEVTYHHHGHEGYKLHISVFKRAGIVVHPAVMKELLVVLSKPKRMSNGERVFDEISRRNTQDVDVKAKFLVQKRVTTDRASKRKLSSAKDDQDPCHSQRDTKKIKIEEDASDIHNLQLNKSSIQIADVLQAYTINGVCFKCRVPVDIQTILRAEYHAVDCAFVDKVLPLFQDVDISKLQQDQGNATSKNIVSIMDTHSFEESCKESMGKSPCEEFDANIFTVDTQDDRSDDFSTQSQEEPNNKLNNLSLPTSKSPPTTSEMLRRPFLIHQKYRDPQNVRMEKEEIMLHQGSNENEELSPMAVMTGQNIFRSNLVDKRETDQDDFLSFLDNLAKDENDEFQDHDISLKGVRVKNETLDHLAEDENDEFQDHGISLKEVRVKSETLED